MPMDPLKAHAMALDAIDGLVSLPAVKKYLKPLDSEATVVYHYKCLICGLDFWTDIDLYHKNDPDIPISCPSCSSECEYKGSIR